jgi:hypothetical protein
MKRAEDGGGGASLPQNAEAFDGIVRKIMAHYEGEGGGRVLCGIKVQVAFWTDSHRCF